MTKPPCMDYDTATDCPRRYVGCRAGCKEWHDWMAIHAEESAAVYAKRHEHMEYNEYTAALIDRREKRTMTRRRQR